MHNILVSALVAAVVTLAIEYLAKPRLEMRKERLLYEDRKAREIASLMRAITFDMGRYSHLMGEDPFPVEEARSLVMHIGERVDRIVEAFAPLDHRLDRLQRDAVVEFSSMLMVWRAGWQESDSKGVELNSFFAEFRNRSDILVDGVSARRWQLPTRIRLLNLLRSDTGGGEAPAA